MSAEITIPFQVFTGARRRGHERQELRGTQAKRCPTVTRRREQGRARARAIYLYTYLGKRTMLARVRGPDSPSPSRT